VRRGKRVNKIFLKGKYNNVNINQIEEVYDIQRDEESSEDEVCF
jgi:hypothetical protein